MLAQLGILIGVMMVFHLTGITTIAIGPIHMTIMWVPIIIGAILLGPAAGAILGAVFGISVLMNMGLITQLLLGVNAPLTIIFMVVIRGIGVGFISGLIYKGFEKLDKKEVWSYEATGLLTSLLNTFMFVAGTAMLFGGNEALLELAYIDDSSRGAVFGALFAIVWAQALIEAAVCTLVAATIARVLKTHILKTGQ